MTKTITGVAGGAPDTTPSMTVPEPGDLAAAAVLEAGLQAHLNETATNAVAVNELSLLVSAGVPVVQHVATIAALKALDGSKYGVGSIAFVEAFAFGYGVGPGGGLFVFVNSSTPEKQVPGVPGAYLVVTPNAGSGRWFNVAGGLGWDTSGFAGRVRREVQLVREQGGPGPPILVSSGSAWVDTGAFVEVVGVQANDAVEVSFVLTAKCLADVGVDFRVAVSLNGAAAVGVSFGQWSIPGGVATKPQGVHLHFAHDEAEAATYRYSVQVDAPTATSVEIFPEWSAIAKRYSAKLLGRTAAPRVFRASPVRDVRKAPCL